MGRKSQSDESKSISKSHAVYLYLKEKILEDEIKPGEFINLNAIAKEMQISKIPVRDGVKQLENIGLVETIPRVGVKVKSLDLDELEQYAAIRRELEAFAARLAAEAIDTRNIKKLKEYIKKMDDYCTTGNNKGYAGVNKDFHRLLYQSCNMPILYNLIVDLWDRSERTKWVFTMFPERMENSNKEHTELVAALEKRDAKKAGDIIYRQKSTGFSGVLKVLKNMQNLAIAQ